MLRHATRARRWSPRRAVAARPARAARRHARAAPRAGGRRARRGARRCCDAIGAALRRGAEVVARRGQPRPRARSRRGSSAARSPRRRRSGSRSAPGRARRTPSARIAELLRPARLASRTRACGCARTSTPRTATTSTATCTIPTFERLGAGVDGARRRPAADEAATPDDYEALLAPLYAWLHVVARHTRTGFGAERTRGSQNAWRVLTAKGPRPLRAARCSPPAFPLAVAAAEPRRPRAGAARRLAGRAAPRRRCGDGRGRRRLGVDARWVLFGHTHRAGPLRARRPGEWGRLVNTGSWVHEEAFLGGEPANSPYWPGTAVEVGPSRAPAAAARRAQRSDARRERDGVALHAVADLEVEHAGRVARVLDERVRAGMVDRDLAAVGAHRRRARTAPPTRRRPRRARPRARLLGRRDDDARLGVVLGAERRQHVALDAEQRLDRALGLA